MKNLKRFYQLLFNLTCARARGLEGNNSYMFIYIIFISNSYKEGHLSA